MIETKQVSDLVGERCFEIVRAGCAVSGKLKIGSVFGARLRINADVRFGNRAGFGIEKDTRARGCRVGIEEFVLRRVGDSDETHAVAAFGWADGVYRTPVNDEVDVRETR